MAARLPPALAQVVAYSFMSSFPLYGELAVCLDESAASLPLYARAEKSVDLINRLFGYVGCRVKYSDYGMKESDIDHMPWMWPSRATGTTSQNFPRIATPQEVKDPLQEVSVKTHCGSLSTGGPGPRRRAVRTHRPLLLASPPPPPLSTLVSGGPR